MDRNRVAFASDRVARPKIDFEVVRLSFIRFSGADIQEVSFLNKNCNLLKCSLVKKKKKTAER